MAGEKHAPLEALKNAEARWREETYEPARRKNAERRESFETLSGLPLEPVSTPADWPPPAFLEKLGFPGEYPFTRGVQPTMYRGRHWTMRQYAGFGTAKESNARYRYLLEQGTTGLSVAFDLPTQMGRDSDHERARGEVGRVGVAIDSVEDLGVLLDQIPLDTVSTSMTINSTAAYLLAAYQVQGERTGVAPERLRGTIQNDVLKEYMARGTYIYPPGPALRIITDVFSYAARSLPAFNTISISGYHIREAGSTAVQEVAFTLADAIAYVEAAQKAGLEVDTFAPRLSFFFNVHNDFLEEIAKFRAARRLWARIMKDRFGAKDPRSQMLRFHSQTAGATLTAQQPEVNVVRVALQTLAAVLGGTQSLHTNSLDEALALPTEHTARIALRTQQVVAHESGVTSLIDPLGGAPAIELLTDRIEAEAEALIARIDGLGGMVEAIAAGWPQQEIQESAYRYQLSVDRGDRKIVGVNAFVDEDETARMDLLRVDPALEAEQCEALARLRSERDGAAAGKALQAVERAARGDENLLPPILEAVRARCTLGEVSDALREVFGEYQEVPVL
ncbi:MAG: methylmalonyl-CoA mutase family protein [Deltaproteobacteria bacterium]|nr:methylmalonyl-CoA mutase family protein [Deltaproteobacteria bacterium]